MTGTAVLVAAMSRAACDVAWLAQITRGASLAAAAAAAAAAATAATLRAKAAAMWAMAAAAQAIGAAPWAMAASGSEAAATTAAWMERLGVTVVWMQLAGAAMVRAGLGKVGAVGTALEDQETAGAEVAGMALAMVVVQEGMRAGALQAAVLAGVTVLVGAAEETARMA